MYKIYFYNWWFIERLDSFADSIPINYIILLYYKLILNNTGNCVWISIGYLLF